MILYEQRRQLVDYGMKMIQSGLTTGSGGNLSILCRVRNLIAIGPSGIDYADLQPEDIVIVDRSGKTVDGGWKPSSELSFHLALYDARADISAVVHTHSVYATTIACLHWEIPAVHYLVGFSGKRFLSPTMQPLAALNWREMLLTVLPIITLSCWRIMGWLPLEEISGQHSIPPKRLNWLLVFTIRPSRSGSRCWSKMRKWTGFLISFLVMASSKICFICFYRLKTGECQPFLAVMVCSQKK